MKLVNLKTGAVVNGRNCDSNNIAYESIPNTCVWILVLGIAKMHQDGEWTFRKFNPIVIILNILLLLTVAPAHLLFGGWSQARKFLIEFYNCYKANMPKVSYLKTLKYIAIVREYDKCL